MTNRKNDTRYHEVLKQASIYVYHNGNAQLPAGYRVIDKAENKKNGFYAEAYSNGKDIIITYRGTEGRFDIQNDIAMAKKIFRHKQLMQYPFMIKSSVKILHRKLLQRVIL